MRTASRKAVVGALMMAALQVGAQNECTDYHRFNCDRSTDARFSVNGQSKSAPVQVGVPTELNIIVYRGQDYRISLCPDERVLGSGVVARLIEKVREPRTITEQVIERQPVYDENGEPTGDHRDVTRNEEKVVIEDVRKVLWDNQEHEMAQEVEFSCTSTKRLVIELIAPGADEVKPKRADMDIGCIGVLIEHMPTPQLGF